MLRNFEKSSLARNVYGDVFMDTFLTTLWHEVELFSRHVTDWEYQRNRQVM